MMLMVLFLLFQIGGLDFNFPFLPELSTIYFTVVNVICFYLLFHVLKKEGRSIKELVGFQKDRVLKDVMYGFLWLFVLYIPFVSLVTGTMFLLYGADFINHFEAVFAGDAGSYSFERPIWLMWIAAFISFIFPFLNAPIEELMFRGYAQPKFIEKFQKVWLAILIPSVGFALQHVLLAASLEGAIVYAVAFLGWGIGSGIIYHKQQRLFPLIICHFIVNIAFSSLPIVLLILDVY